MFVIYINFRDAIILKGIFSKFFVSGKYASEISVRLEFSSYHGNYIKASSCDTKS